MAVCNTNLDHLVVGVEGVGVGHHRDQEEVVGEGVQHHQGVVVEQYQFLVGHHLLVDFVATCIYKTWKIICTVH